MTVSPYLDDGDVRLFHGDAATVLARLPEGSVDCCVTSPPYFGLRDYGTASWEGGDPACDHAQSQLRRTINLRRVDAASGRRPAAETYQDPPTPPIPYRGTCGKCGAVRHDVQIGLEPTSEEYVAALVAVFRQVWRVLAPWGTCWVNVGDSYAAQGGSKEAAADWQAARTPPAGTKPKDLLMMPARLALALQADGWWVRSRIVWTKPNPMPESVTDRPTSAHEDVYLLTKAPRYYWDAEAVREASTSPEQEAHNQRYARVYDGPSTDPANGQPGNVNNGGIHSRPGPGGRNLRNVWSIATEPTPEAHFATFPLELVRRCLAAGCPEKVCRECGEPSRRIVERSEPSMYEERRQHDFSGRKAAAQTDRRGSISCGRPENSGVGYSSNETTGWTDCGHDAYRPGVVLDPFVGSGKTCQQARRMGLHAVGIDASEEYLGIAARRLQQLSLLGGAA